MHAGKVVSEPPAENRVSDTVSWLPGSLGALQPGEAWWPLTFALSKGCLSRPLEDRSSPARAPTDRELGGWNLS